MTTTMTSNYTSNSTGGNIMPADMFLTRALEKILSDKEIKKQSSSQLKKYCDSLLTDLKKDAKTKPTSQYVVINDTEKYFLPFELACKSKSPKTVEAALDCIQKLIVHGYLNDSSHIASSSMINKQQLIQRIAKTISQCFEGPQVDDVVQLQIVKCLLTILTSPHFEIHEQTMLLAIKTCYNIQITSGSLVNQASARAALTQIINTVLYRFDTSVCKASTLKEDKKQESFKNNKNDETISVNESTYSTTDNDHITNLNEMMTQTLVLNSEHYKPVYMDILRNFECEQLNFDLNEMNSLEENANSISDLMCTMLDAICGDEPDTFSIDAKLNDQKYENGIIMTAKHLNDDDIIKRNGHSPALSTTSETKQSNLNIKDPELIGIDDSFELDTFMMFRAFCKLSLRSINSDNNIALMNTNSQDFKNSIEIKSKILSLQLILATLQNAKQSFKQSPHMISVIRRYLCVSLSKNGVSPVLEVFELSLAIFVSLLADYKQHLKKQIEVFFREIIIYLLESSTSSFDHKWLVIQALTHVCANAQCVVDLYINYDCDLQSSNIFARLINVLSKKAQGRQQVDAAYNITQLRSIRLKGLECVVSILKCMVEWSKDLYINPNSLQSNLGPENRPQISETTEMNKIRSYNSQNSLDSSTSGQHNQTSIKHNGDFNQLNSSYNPNDFDMLKTKKELWEKGIELFNKKPKKGVQFLQDSQLLGRSCEELAQFLIEDDRLDKTAIGDFLGENEKFNKEVMYSYIDQMDFYGMEIVSALRLFLEGFRLPGEAQKIDRLMEKFAARYHELNKKFGSQINETNQDKSPSLNKNKKTKKRLITNYYFESADAVYVLAFSIIMLATDLHSSQVKKKMTKENYINMNRGINDNKDLPKEFLESIFDQVAESEIKLKGGNASLSSNKNQKAESEKQRRLLYNMEIEQVTQTARSLMESVYHVTTNFTSAKYGEHIMPMFKLAWTPSLAAFSIGIQDSDDNKIIDLCLNGIRCAIRIACIFHLELERDAYMQALARFTLLTASLPITEIKTKNIECIKTLITISHTDGNYLGKSWYEVLKCISQLELAQSTGINVINNNHNQRSSLNGNSSLNSNSTLTANQSSTSNNSMNLIAKESSLLNQSLSNTSNISLNSFNYSDHQTMSNNPPSYTMSSSTLDSKSLANIQMQLGETASQSIVVAIDRIFTGSARLDGDAIVEFVKWLCFVSVDELSASPPRMFSLQKLVEISYYNMGRIRLQWTRIWNVIGEHFNKAGCNPNEEVAFFAVDSLRQLTMKFLEKGEFANFRFQKEFLKPFEHIMKKNNSYTIKDMVVQCVAQMVKSQAQNIKSGWKNIFGVFHLAASQNDERIVNLSFETVNEIIRVCAEKYFLSILDSFQDAIKCLSEFACNSASPDISIEAIGLIRHCAMFVAEKPDIFVEYGSEDLKNVPEDDRVWMKGWFPILFELSCIINRCKLDVRTRGLTVMFEIMKTYGESFKPQWWKELFNIVFRIFDNMKLPEAQIEKAEWMTTTCNHALYAIVDVFTQYFDTISQILIEDLYTHLKWCVKQDNEQLARSGTNCFENFVISNGVKFNEDIWRKSCTCLSEIFKFTIPYNLITWRPDQESSNNSFESNDSSITNDGRSNRNGRLNSSTSINSIYADDSKSKIPRSRVPEMEHKVFQNLLIKCVVQLELIQTIDSIVFYPTTSKKEDANYIAAAQALSSPVSSPSSTNNLFINDHMFHDEFGMYVHLSNEQLFQLLDCLEETYEFSRQFNCNSEQRNILWKAGFKGKDKPNLLKHETQSLACMLRILFKMYNDESKRDYNSSIQTRLARISQSALQYYLILPSENHRESWDNIMLLLLTKILKLEPIKFKSFSCILYRYFCDILTFNLRPELRNILREIFLTIGSVNNIPINC